MTEDSRPETNDEKPIDTGVFIGGPLDGQRTQIYRNDYTVYSLPDGPLGAAEPTTYSRLQVAGINCWVASSLSIHEAMLLLLTNYRPEKAP